jgi:ribose transport system permease protein
MSNEVKKAHRAFRIAGPDAWQKMLAFASLIILLVIFSFASPNFFKMDNLVAIMLATAVNGVLSIAVTFVIITAGIDLSVGFVMTFSAVLAGICITNLGLPIWVGIAAALATGAVCGALSGAMVAKMKIAPFIATLGMMMFTKGLSLVISGTKPIYFSNTPEFSSISMDSVVGMACPFLPIPNAVLVFFTIAVISGFILNKTVLGRYTFALGSNEEAIRLSGVNVDRWKIVIYSLCGLLCGIAGILIASRLNSAQPALGTGYETDAIAAAVIGGASLSGGAGTILGTVIGAFIISVLTNGLRILSVPQEWQIVVTGGIIIFAVYMDILRRRK